MSYNDELKALLKRELGYLPPGPSIDELLERGEAMTFARGDVIVNAGAKHPDVYIIKSGITRFIDMNGEHERTFAFALAGTVFMSKHSFVMDRPSYYQVEACCDSELLCIPRADFWDVVNRYHELTLWMLKYAYTEFFFQEYKNAVVHNGSASDRFRSMLNDRTEIIEKVPQKIIASYLGVTPEYLSKLKRQFLKSRNIHPGKS